MGFGGAASVPQLLSNPPASGPSMASYNKVILMGNLTRDPELRYTQNNMAICKVGMALNRRFKDSQSEEWREEVTFVDVTIFGRRGEAFEKYHKKGQSAFFEGSLRFDTLDDKNTGQKRSKLYVVADNWEFVNAGREGSGSYQGGASQDEAGRRQGSTGGRGEPAGGDYAEAGGGSLEADDTPF